jgi:DNA gyrase/topoisomerase IV subunit A
MDFDFGTSPSNEEQNNNQSQPSGDQKLTNLDDMLNMDFQPLNEQNQNPSQSDPKPKNENEPLNMDFLMNDMNQINQSNSPKIDEEEEKRISDRKKEAEERREKINEKIKKEEELRNEIRKKANEYMIEFEQKRQEDIAKRRKELEQKNSETNTNASGGNNADSWGKVNSNIDLKDYKGSKDVQRMREAMMNRTNDPNSEPLKNFFG